MVNTPNVPNSGAEVVKNIFLLVFLRLFKILSKEFLSVFFHFVDKMITSDLKKLSKFLLFDLKYVFLRLVYRMIYVSHMSQMIIGMIL